MTQVSDAPAGRTRAQIAERTLRTDPWYNRGRVVATLLTIWVAYATVRVFTGHWYYVPADHYLTPFYSPCVSGECVAGSSARVIITRSLRYIGEPSLWTMKHTTAKSRPPRPTATLTGRASPSPRPFWTAALS